MTRGGCASLRLGRTASIAAGIAALLALGGCAGEDGSPADADDRRRIVDAAGDTLAIVETPARIVSLVPSVSQVIADLGEDARLVGRTRYDTAAAFADLPSVGEGMGPDYEALLALDPEIVVYFYGASDPETPAQLARLGMQGFAVRPLDVEDVMELYGTFGEILDRGAEADTFATGLQATLDSIGSIAANLPRKNVSYLLDGDPPWAAGPGTYIGQLVDLAGGDLLPENLPELYAPISPEDLVAAPLEVILISGASGIDDRLVEGRRLERIPAWVELPGPVVRDAAWVILRAIHPELAPR